MAVTLVISGCVDPCGDTLVASKEAPDGKHRAVLFERSCGMTSGFSTQVSVLREGQRLRGGGNVIVADDDHGAARVGAWGGPWMDIEWAGPTHLVVRYAGGARIFSQATKVNSVSISFEEVR